MDSITSQTRVVISTAGPFALIGTPVVEAAVRGGAHYVDITGETPWVKEMIAAHHEAAAAKGLRIVPCCGFDSIPFDLGALLVGVGWVLQARRGRAPTPHARSSCRLLRPTGYPHVDHITPHLKHTTPRRLPHT